MEHQIRYDSIKCGFARLQIIKPDYLPKKWYFDRVIKEDEVPNFSFYKKSSTIYENVEIDPKFIVGTSHDNYSDSMWIEMLGNLKRGSDFDTTPDTIKDGIQINVSGNSKCVSKYGDFLIIHYGNHRLCIAKFLEVQKIKVDILHVYELDIKHFQIYQSFLARNLQAKHEQVFQTRSWHFPLNDKQIILNENLVDSFFSMYDNSQINLKSLTENWLLESLGMTHNENSYFLNEAEDLKKLSPEILQHKIKITNRK